ncbi:LysM peptidoglycan-binding domain-containing protein [Hymenobacter sp. BT175]|uniref:LysM peptidoglycan-binding domain-containing protein n=1 Tax=Hymenobacter translucens TaxID=2886507 RepID=UPI001D0F176F|nr:LysM peptidoglycan-binding domain-containing protein [Hymenobacter translucens]MCC2547227.1 LysM peptidoglycan-binding domain-containing protein [Hymenobacter translucens]
MKKSLWRAAPFLFLAAISRPLAAQELPEQKPAGSSSDDTTRVELQLQLRGDSLVAEPRPSLDSLQLLWARTPPTMRELVGDRISCFETDVPHQFNGTVMAFVEYFTIRNRKYTQRILERQNLYFPLFEKYLAKYKLPQDLKYLAVVESALLPQARSKVGAVGLWQFMGPTASDMRLQRNEYIDERMNPEKSTEAACKYLRDLYRMFGDWELVLAAYNWGGGNMRRVMKRTGKTNFWDLYPHLPKETRNYVPTFTALLYTMTYAKEHNLHDETLQYQYAEATDTLIISNRSLDLRKFAAQFGLDSSAIQRHNPELRKHYIPETFRNYKLTIPTCVRTELAVQDRNTLLDFCKVTLPPPPVLQPRIPGLEPVDSTASTAVAAAEKSEADKPKYRRVYHRVRKGETIGTVAERFEVSSAQLRRWNGLRKGKALAPRQELLVFVPMSETASQPVVARKTPLPAVKAVAVEAVAATIPAEEPAVQPTALAASDSAAVAVVNTTPSEPQPHPAVATAHTSSRPTRPAKVPVAVPADNNVPEIPVVKPVVARAAKTEKSTRPAPVEVAAAPADTAPEAPLATEYVVRKGDYLTRLARERNLTVAQLVAWNKLKSETVVPGQKLRLTAPADEDKFTAVAAASRATRPARAAAEPAPGKLPAGKIHLVQPGDTLYNISRRYPGLTVDQLRKLNNLTSDEVKPGQKLLVAS